MLILYHIFCFCRIKEDFVKNKESNIGIIIAIAIAAIVVGLFTIKIFTSEIVEVGKYDVNTVIGPNDDNGNIGDNIEGNPDAPIKIFEYADYQCSGCATAFPRMKKLVEEYDGKLAIVYRNFLLSYHQNGTAAASAAQAAGIQGYWSEYATKLFEEQATWASATGSERTDLFKGIFRSVSNGKGDEEKFVEDMSSSRVKAKIKFDESLSKNIDITGTPTFYLDGEKLDFDGAGARTEEDFLNFMRVMINAKLESLEK